MSRKKTASDDQPEAVEIIVENPELSIEEETKQRALQAVENVYDADAEAWLPVTQEMIANEQLVRNAWFASKHVQCAVVKTIFDQGLHLAAGFETREAYCQQVLGITRRTAQNMRALADKFGPFLPTPEGLKQLGTGDDGKTFSHPADPDIAKQVQGIDVSKLYALTRLEDDELATILEGDYVETPDGQRISLQSIHDASAREAGEMVKKLRGEFKGKLQRDSERAKLAEAERDVFRDRMEKAEAELAELRDAELLFGPAQKHAQAQLSLLEMGSAHLNSLAGALDQVSDDPNIPKGVQRALASMLQRLETFTRDFSDRVSPITSQL